MAIIDIEVAGEQLDDLIDRALAGEDVVIARDGTPLVRLVPFVTPSVDELLPSDHDDRDFKWLYRLLTTR